MGDEEIDHLQDQISATLKMVFAGTVADISAQMVLSRYIQVAKPPQVLKSEEF